MKKRWLGAMALVLSVAMLAGCNGKKEDAETATEQSAAQTQTQTGETLVKPVYNPEDYVTLGEYKGVTVSSVAASHTEEDVDLQAKQFYFNYVKVEEGITDRAVEQYDMTNIDYCGKKDGVAFDGGTAEGAQLLIGSGQFIEGFEEGLIGVMPGETVDLNLKFPEAYHSAELAGAEVVFTVTVNFIPQMEDAHVSEIGIPNVSTVDELYAYVEDMMTSQELNDYLTASQDEVYEQVAANATFGELPEELLIYNKAYYADMLDRMAAAYGMDGKSYVEAMGGEYESALDNYAVIYTKQTLILEAIANKENLNITDEELDDKLEFYAAQSGTTVEALLAQGLSKEDFRQSFLYEDVMSFLVENAVSAQ